MTKRTFTYLLPFAALLLMGSSGCTKSDITDVMEILGGSQGVTVVDYAQHQFGESTGDKNKDGLLETGDTMEAVKKASELEDAANVAMTEKPPNYDAATKKLEEAAKLRPDDWGLQNRLASLELEQNRNPKVAATKTEAICEGEKYPDKAAKERCHSAVNKDREGVFEASVEQQKKRGSIVSCTTYTALIGVYRELGDYTTTFPCALDASRTCSITSYNEPYDSKIRHLRGLVDNGGCSGKVPSS